MLRTVALSSLVGLTLACATPVQKPIDVSPLTPRSGERVAPDQAAIIFDASSSVSRRSEYPGGKALLQSFVAAMPEGSYQAGATSFGGGHRHVDHLAAFDRAALADFAGNLHHIGGSTPLSDVLGHAEGELAGQGQQAAVVLFSDGLPTDSILAASQNQAALDAAASLAGAYKGKVCFHTVQLGNDPAGTAFLQKLAGSTDCGSHRLASATNSAGAIEQMAREVFIAGAPRKAPVARPTPGDKDGDGVTDDRDECPGTPAGAQADSRGCWTIPGLEFATNSAEIRPIGRKKLIEQVLPVLNANPDLRIRIDGHTDSRGSAAYNQGLSERRAKSVRDFLVSQGIAGSRVSSQGFGESKPIAPNDTPENLQRNRRTELTVL